MDEREARFMLAAGATALWLIALSGGVGFLLFTVAIALLLVGSYRMTKSPIALGLIAIPVIVDLVAYGYDLVPRRARMDTFLGEALFIEACAHVGVCLKLAAGAAGLVLLRARVGLAVAVMAVAWAILAMLLAFIAVVLSIASASTLGAIESGPSGVRIAATLISAAGYSIAAIEPPAPGARASAIDRVLLCAGAFGALLLVTTIHGEIEASAGHRPLVLIGWLVTMALAWTLIAAGMAGLARTGGGIAAWVGLGLALLEILVCAPVPFVFERHFEHAVAFALVPISLGLLAIVITSLGGMQLPWRSTRIAIGLAALVPVFGACLVLPLYFLADSLDLDERSIFFPLSESRWIVRLALALLAALSLFIAGPPEAREAT